MAINNTAVGTSPSSIYTSTGSSAITTIHLCNYTGSPITANLYAVPSGGSANNSTLFYSNVQITAYNTLIISTEKLILDTGDAIYANVSASNSVTATVSSIGI
jgi:hypothetical protein